MRIKRDMHTSALDCPTMRWCRTTRKPRENERGIRAKESLIRRGSGSSSIWRIQLETNVNDNSVVDMKTVDELMNRL